MSPLDEVLARAAGDERAGFLSTAGPTSWRTWAGQVERFRAQLGPWSRATVGLKLRPTPASFAALAALAREGCDVDLLDWRADAEAIAELSRERRWEAVGDVDGDDLQLTWFAPESSKSGHGGITLFTSGSTGRPKAVLHTWETLTRPVRRDPEGGGGRWLLTYRPNLYAGLQVFLQCLLNRAPLVLPSPDGSARDVVGLMRGAAVSHVSATPSYWRWLVAMAGPKALSDLELAQITLGGEVADQAVLDLLSRLFPGARLVHIYATSEAGRCFSVTDGREGFPARLLEEPTRDGVELKIEDGELLVRSRNAMSTGAPAVADSAQTAMAWWPTGDLVEQIDDRVRFVGRRTDVINVGGNKVHPLAVEQVVRAVLGVADTRVYARKSSLAGFLVACEIVVEPGFEPEPVRLDVQRTCLAQLASHQRPRFLEVVPAIHLSGAGKKVRMA
jgi:acyl-CoA synthetase (AMP-forming)/AMP-acid ligase II